MELTLLRKIFTDRSTIGEIVLDGRIFSTIEDHDRGLTQSMSVAEVQKIKVYGKTCIPYGRYKVVITKSPRFSAKKGKPVFTPQLVGVTGFDGIRIHIANWAEQLEGCIAPGLRSGMDCVIDSSKAYNYILDKISLAIRAGEDVYINIRK